MIRTNHTFLNYFEEIYKKDKGTGNIELQSFARGGKMLIQGQQASKVMFIKEGIAKCYFAEENGKEYIVEFLGNGEILGEMELIKNTTCLCSVEAVSEVVVYAASHSYFRSLIDHDIKLNHLLLDAFAERIVNTSSRASYQQLYTIEHTVVQLLAMQAKQGIEISKEDMAAYLGIAVRSLNRILKNRM